MAAISVWVNMPRGNTLKLRAPDETGQTFQREVYSAPEGDLRETADSVRRPDGAARPVCLCVPPVILSIVAPQQQETRSVARTYERLDV